MQQDVYRQLSEMMGGLLPSFVVSARRIQVLDIGWGMAESVHELALKYPTFQITGIAKDEPGVFYTQSLLREFSNVSVCMQNIFQFDDGILSPASYELIHLHYLVGEIRLQEIPQLLQSLTRLSRQGGYIVWTEAELPITTSLAFQHLCSLLLQALQMRGYTHSQGNSLGLTARMGSILDDAGYKYIHSKAYAIDISARTKGNETCISQLNTSRQEIRAFLQKSGLTTDAQFEDLYAELQQEIREERFCGLVYIRTMVAKR